MSPEDQQATCENTARAMSDAELFIKQRHVRHCYYADPAYGKGVAEALGISLEEALKAEDPAHPAWTPAGVRRRSQNNPAPAKKSGGLKISDRPDFTAANFAPETGVLRRRLRPPR